MAANGFISSSGYLDSRAGYMRPTFATASDESGATLTYFGGPHWTCPECTLRVGPTPSTAVVRIPLAAVQDETCPSVVGVRSTNLDAIRQGTQCCIDGYQDGTATASTPLLVGRVIDISGDIDKDEKIITIADDRYLLEAFQVIGQFHVSGTDGTEVSYRQGWPAHFNAGGMPNGVIVDIFGYPVKVFCPPNWNIPDGQAPDQKSTTSASYFSIADILIYLQFIATGTAASIAGNFLFYPKLPTTVIWPRGYESALADGTLNQVSSVEQINTAKETAERKGREFIAEGMPILAIMTEVLEAAGHFGVYLGAQKSGSGDSTQYNSIIQIVKTRYMGGGISISRPSSGAAADVLTQINVVTGGNIKFSGRSLYTKAALGGGLVYIERRCNSEQGVTNIGTNGLVKAWSPALEEAARLEIQVLMAGVGVTEDAFPAKINEVLSKPKYSKIFQAYRLASDWDFQANTSESGMPRCVTGRPILPHLLTSFIESGLSTAPIQPYERLNAYCDVRPENNLTTAYTTPSSPTWHLPDRNDGMAIDADGTIWLPGLRRKDTAYTASVSTPGQNECVVTLKAAAIRMTVAIPCDHRINAAFKLGIDKTPGLPVYSPPPGGDDSDLIDETLSRLYYADARQLYTKHLRVGSGGGAGVEQYSFATPQSINGTPETDKSGDPETSVIRDDINYATAHLRKRLGDLGRVARTGRLIIPHLAFAWNAGDGIKDLQNTDGSSFPIRGMPQAVSFYADGDNPQMTEIEIA